MSGGTILRGDPFLVVLPHDQSSQSIPDLQSISELRDLTPIGPDPDRSVADLYIARRLRGETTVTLKWIADELRMGAWTYLSNNLSRTAGKPSR